MSKPGNGDGSIETGAAATRAAVIRPRIPGNRFDQRDEQSSLEEAVGLAAAIDLDVVLSEILPVNRVRPNTFIGSGALERLKGALEDLQASVAIFDCKLSPVQQRNLERGLNVKVIDRTGLILEIFGARARTHEGRLQVELAALSYQRSRLVRSWTHLERQRGGFGFLGGPGESQLEIDRRLIGDRIVRLKRELEEVRRTRDLQRKGRKRADLPVVALVGYTNAGKSTLFNRLTASEVFAKDLLFATLDPTMRAVRLPSGRSVVLSDTVGFIADLPTDLVAAFRATLEEVIEADVIVHVRDVAHPDSEAQREDVEAVLSDIGLHERIVAGELIEALNKIDLIDDVARQRLLGSSPSAAGARVPISALTGEGVEDLLHAIDTALAGDEQAVELDVPQSDGALLAWLYRHGRVLHRQDGEGITHLRVMLDAAARARLDARRQQARPA
ncbi:MAG: GTPase HflX [Reyranellaceae bacterium]